MRRSRLAAAGLVVSTALLAAYTSSSPARSEPVASVAKRIASASTTDFRVVVTATNLGGGGEAPAASVTVRTFERAGGAWRRTSERRLAGTYFWKTITGPLAVCRLELRTTAATPAFRPRAIVQLLRSPSLGCGPASEHRLTG
jgi:Flp pilus assembly protein CpaB